MRPSESSRRICAVSRGCKSGSADRRQSPRHPCLSSACEGRSGIARVAVRAVLGRSRRGAGTVEPAPVAVRYQSRATSSRQRCAPFRPRRDLVGERTHCQRRARSCRSGGSGRCAAAHRRARLDQQSAARRSRAWRQLPGLAQPRNRTARTRPGDRRTLASRRIAGSRRLVGRRASRRGVAAARPSRRGSLSARHPSRPGRGCERCGPAALYCLPGIAGARTGYRSGSVGRIGHERSSSHRLPHHPPGRLGQSIAALFATSATARFS